VTGRLSGKIDLTGSGADAAAAMKTVRGTARIDVVDGIVKKLGLVKNVVVATSMREGATKQAMSGGSTDEPFTRLGSTLRIGNGLAATDDLRFESKDLILTAAGNVRLDASNVDLAGRVQLSDELTKQAGSDLARYTAEQGRVTLPATIKGPADNLSVKIDVADMAKRAITNRATEEAEKQLKKGLGGLLRRP
jgi:AsmA protein